MTDFSTIPGFLAVSDTHGDVAALSTVLSWAKRKGLIHLVFLGDGTADIPAAMDRSGYQMQVHKVRGNGDYGPQTAQTLVFEFDSYRFFLCHGHQFGVQDGYGPLLSAAGSVKADAALFGHTHRPFREEIQGKLVLNPGSLSRPRGKTGPSFASIQCPQNGWFIIRYWTLENGLGGKKRVRELDISSF